MFSYGEQQVHVCVPHKTCSRGGLLQYVSSRLKIAFALCVSSSVFFTSLLEHHSMSQSSQAHQRSPHRIQEQCPHAHPSLETTARVSPPRHWEVSIGWHTHQDMAILLAHRREGADSFSMVLLSPFVTETWFQKMVIICFHRWCRESFSACVMPRLASVKLGHAMKQTVSLGVQAACKICSRPQSRFKSRGTRSHMTGFNLQVNSILPNPNTKTSE